MTTKTGVAIVGASGYAARELFRIMLNHPHAELTVATSRNDEEPSLQALHPSLAGRTTLRCEPFDAARVAAKASYAFLALPHTASMAIVPELRARRGMRMIDLSARLPAGRPAGLRGLVWPRTHGPPRIGRGRLWATGAFPRADPGCGAGCQPRLLHLSEHPGAAPLVALDRIERTGIIIDAKSGVSGAGRSPKLTTHFPECNESLSAYSVGKHRHTPEIDQVLSEVTGGQGDRVEVIFTPHLVPMDRGIFATVYAQPKGGAAVEHELLDVYRRYYARSPFIRVVEHLPATKDSAFTNYCDITVRVVRGKIVILACLDNLIKGAAGVAVQNLNLMLGCAEETALF